MSVRPRLDITGPFTFSFDISTKVRSSNHFLLHSTVVVLRSRLVFLLPSSWVPSNSVQLVFSPILYLPAQSPGKDELPLFRSSSILPRPPTIWLRKVFVDVVVEGRTGNNPNLNLVRGSGSWAPVLTPDKVEGTSGNLRGPTVHLGPEKMTFVRDYKFRIERVTDSPGSGMLPEDRFVGEIKTRKHESQVVEVGRSCPGRTLWAEGVRDPWPKT